MPTAEIKLLVLVRCGGKVYVHVCIRPGSEKNMLVEHIKMYVRP